MTRKGEILLEAERIVQATSLEKPRYCTINCGLNPKRAEGQKPRLTEAALQPLFQKVARTFGAYKHVVSLVANQIIIRHPDSLYQIKDGTSRWKSFYDKTWSAVEAVLEVEKKRRGSEKVSADALEERAITRHGLFYDQASRIMGTSMDVLVKYIPEKGLFDLRQQEAVQMATQSKEHLLQFPDRLEKVIAVRLAEAFSALTWTEVDKITKMVKWAILCDPRKLDGYLEKIKASADKEVVDFALGVVEEERMHLGELVQKERRFYDFEKSVKGNTEQLLPHLLRLSKWSEEWMDTHFKSGKEQSEEEEEERERLVK